MRSEIAIAATRLTKNYRVFGHPGDRIKQAMTLGRVRFHREFTALQDVSFVIRRGETLGIIGRNGSGKSTLLQLICGILKPTSGQLTVNGRISALLELGAGFNPEFTGRENVYFQGAVLGLSKGQVDEQFDQIAAFADIGDFIDEPVRIYSSGMYVRLAFASAIHSSPDILVVDEALSVGDAAFQRKCFEHIRQFREQGGTIIYVSHDMTSVVEHCDHAILLERGKLGLQGPPKNVIAQYLKNAAAEYRDIADVFPNNQAHNTTKIGDEYFDPTLIPESTVSFPVKGAHITHPRLLSLNGAPVNLLHSGEEYVYAFDAHFDEDADNVSFRMMIRTTSGFPLGGLTSHPFGRGISASQGCVHSQCFRFRCNLLPGIYFINAVILRIQPEAGEYLMHKLMDAAMFRVLPESGSLNTGLVNISPFAPQPQSLKNEG